MASGDGFLNNSHALQQQQPFQQVMGHHAELRVATSQSLPTNSLSILQVYLPEMHEVLDDIGVDTRSPDQVGNIPLCSGVAVHCNSTILCLLEDRLLQFNRGSLLTSSRWLAAVR